MKRNGRQKTPLRIAVIGAGLGGLSAAMRLSRYGFEVDVFEKNPDPGGKAGSINLGPYRFDAGPSLFTMPEVFEQLFDEAGGDADKTVNRPVPVPLEIICRYFFHDGSRLDAFADRERMKEEIARTMQDPPEALDRYLAYSQRIHDLTREVFLERSLHEVSTYASRAFLRALPHMSKIDLFRTMDGANRSFFKDPKLVQLFNRYATYNGSSPFRVPGTLNIIPWVEYGGGGYAVKGGIHTIPKTMEQACRRNGVTFHYSTPVNAILTERASSGRIHGIQTMERKLSYPVVISNADVSITYEKLLHAPNAPRARRYRKLEPSSSALVFYWGMSREFSDLKVNNIFFSSDYRSEFSDIFDMLQLPCEPTIYVNITSKVNTDDAPEGGENWFVLVNAPRAKHSEGSAGIEPEEMSDIQRIRTLIISRISRELGISGSDLEGSIAVEHIRTPGMIAFETGSFHGSLYGISSNTPGAAFLRHPNRSRRHPGLFYCGGSAHPGGGMPLAVLSGKIASDLIKA